MIKLDFSRLGEVDVEIFKFRRKEDFNEQVKDIVFSKDLDSLGAGSISGGVYLLCFVTKETPYECEVYISENANEIIKQCEIWVFQKETKVYMAELENYKKAYKIAWMLKEESVYSGI